MSEERDTELAFRFKPDSGPFGVGEHAGEIYVESDDFHHDACLIVKGDFATREDRIAYARDIANRLNAHIGKNVKDRDDRQQGTNPQL